ncbi:MAG: ribonuclease D [Woeseiaceae bacterium]|nr:ribonuclease D [Woeseiaceae bacterium]
MTDFIFVDDHSTIPDQCYTVDRIGVDTEFLREKTFLAQLCLIQVATREQIYCIDPLRSSDYAAMWEALCRPEWVVHSGRQDIEVIYQTAARMPSSLFDTQVAAGLLGYAPQMGYANLVEELFDVQLPKTHTRADWSQRPLPHALLEYAADDVEYLLLAYDVLAEKLDKLGRLDWARQDSALLLDPALYEIRPEDAIDRLKGARNLRGVRRAIASRLAEWRESEALARNRPRQWILRDAALIDMAYRQPQSLSALKSIESIPDKVAKRAGEELLDVIRSASGEDSAYKPPQPPSERQKSLLKEMQSMVAKCARELGIPAEIVAAKKELSYAVTTGQHDSRVFSNWRRELIGDALIEKLSA